MRMLQTGFNRYRNNQKRGGSGDEEIFGSDEKFEPFINQENLLSNSLLIAKSSFFWGVLYRYTLMTEDGEWNSRVSFHHLQTKKKEKKRSFIG